MRHKLNIIFTLFCLFCTSLVTIATSKKSDDQSGLNQAPPETLSRRDYYVASNCPQAIQQERITVTNERIEYPSNLNFYYFGLPADRLNLMMTQQIADNMSGRQRNCNRSEMTDQQGIPLIIYSCYENGTFLCQVSFEPAQ